METFSASLVLYEVDLPVTGGFPLTKASDAELGCFLWSAPEHTPEQTIETPVIWYAIALIMASLWCKNAAGCIIYIGTVYLKGYVQYID